MALEVITLAEAAKLSNNKLVQGVIEDVVSNNAWYQYLPFVMFEGLAYTFSREKELAKVAFAAPGANLNQTKYQKGATFQNVNVNLASIIGDIIINGHIQDQLSETNGQLPAQISSKAKAMGRFYMNAIINGKRVPGGALAASNNGPVGIEQEFDGMKRILDAEQGNVDDVNHPFYNAGNPTQTKELVEQDPASPRLGFKGAAFSLEDLDDLIARVTAGECHFLMMHTRDINTLKTLMRNTGHGVNSITVQEPGLGTKKPMLYYDGIPVFRNDYVSITEGVNPLATAAVSVVGATSITFLFDNTGADIVAGMMAQIRGADGILRKYKITAATVANPCVLTVAVAGDKFLDVEHNELLDQLAPNATGLNLVGEDLTVYERADGSEIYAGRFGEMEGVCGFGLLGDKMGWSLVEVGARENEDAYQLRLRWRVGFDLYKRLSLARLKYVLPLGA